MSFLWFEESSSSSCLESVHGKKNALRIGDLNLCSPLSFSRLSVIPPFSALTSFHLCVSSMPSPSSNPWYEVIARVECRTSNRGWNAHSLSHTYTHHTHAHIRMSCCVYIEHIPLSESSPNLQSHWLFLSPIHKVRQINGRNKDCLDKAV